MRISYLLLLSAALLNAAEFERLSHQSLCRSYVSSRAIVEGSITQVDDRADFAHLTVDKVLKGFSRKNLYLRRFGVDFEFHPGSRYLIFVGECLANECNVLDGGRIATNTIAGQDEAGIQQLQELVQWAKTSLQAPDDDSKLRLIDERDEYYYGSNESGEYDFRPLPNPHHFVPPGSSRVDFSARQIFQTTVRNLWEFGGCQLEITLPKKVGEAMVRGRVFEQRRRDVLMPMMIELIPDDPYNAAVQSCRVGEAGQFQFSNVKVGGYVLAVRGVKGVSAVEVRTDVDDIRVDLNVGLNNGVPTLIVPSRYGFLEFADSENVRTSTGDPH